MATIREALPDPVPRSFFSSSSTDEPIPLFFVQASTCDPGFYRHPLFDLRPSDSGKAGGGDSRPGSRCRRARHSGWPADLDALARIWPRIRSGRPIADRTGHAHPAPGCTAEIP